MEDLRKLLNPSSIAVIGASRTAGKVGNVILSKIQQSGYQGELYPVNPNADRINGLTCYESVLDIEKAIDVAVVVIPAAFVKDVLADCGQKGIKYVVIITAGFAEAGAAGGALEQELLDIAEKNHIKILGPNCLGYINTFAKLNVTFSDADPLKDGIALISQSGAIGTAFLDWARDQNVGLAHFVSLGNKIGLNENDFLASYYKDPKVHVILIYLEEFSNGKEFLELAKKISLKKPIVVLKPGRSSVTRQAMQSHTGSLAQDELLVAAALKEAGCIQVASIEELFNLTKILSWQPPLSGNRVVIITNAGGIGIQAVDDLSNNGFIVPPLPEMLLKKFKHIFANQINISNPIDLLGDASAEMYRKSLEIIITNNQIDAIMVVLSPQKVTEALLTAELVNKIADKNHKLVMASFVGGERLKTAVQFLNINKIPHFTFPNDAARTLGLVWQWCSHVSLLSKKLARQEFAVTAPTVINPDLNRFAGYHGVVDLKYIQKLLQQYKINLVPSILANSSNELIKHAKKIGFPVVLKIVHSRILHKTEFNAVRLNLVNIASLLEAFTDLEKIVKSQSLKNASYELQPYFQEKLEIFLGVKKDPDIFKQVGHKQLLQRKGFGHFLIIGTGGIYTEIFRDIAVKIFPITTKNEASLILLQTKVGQMLSGARGKLYNVNAVLNMILNLSELVSRNSNIKEIDINPLFVTSKDAYVADVKVLV